MPPAPRPAPSARPSRWPAGAALACALLPGCGVEGEPGPGALALPATMVWAWERPEPLVGLDPRSAGVALLVLTLAIAGCDDDDPAGCGEGDRVQVRPRLSPVRLPAGAAVLPVVRIEVEARSRPRLGAVEEQRVVEELLRVGRRGGRLQIDFEATASQRPFYRRIVGALRARAPRLPLSVTALASWCLADGWLADLPVDEVVPMYYRLGPRRAEAEGWLARHGDFAVPACRRAIGTSLDEPVELPAAIARRSRRRYLWSPRPWSEDALALAALGPGRR